VAQIKTITDTTTAISQCIFASDLNYRVHSGDVDVIWRLMKLYSASGIYHRCVVRYVLILQVSPVTVLLTSACF